MTPNTLFRVNSPKVIHEIIDGEAVIVHLDTGAYYSTDKVGAAVWDLLSRGMSIGQIIHVIANQSRVNFEDIDEGIANFVTQLQEENLILFADENQPVDLTSPGNNPDSAAHLQSLSELSYKEPLLHKYTDMEDLLLLDPIHDVDETGWPNTNPKNA
jgi:hypothetical protein